MKKVIEYLLELSDNELDPQAKKMITSWSDPPKYQEVYDTIAMCCNYSWTSNFVVRVLSIIEDDAKKNIGE